MTVATVSMDEGTIGKVTAVSQGTTTITATSGALSDTSTVLVVYSALQSIAISGGESQLPEGVPLQLVAIATFADGSTADVTDLVTWTSTDSNAVTIDPNDPGVVKGGEVLADLPNAGDVSASLGGVTSPGTSVAVVEATLQSVSITPATVTLSPAGTSNLVASALFSNGLSIPVTKFAKWTSSTRDYATVKNSPAQLKGFLTGIVEGSSTISAKWDTKTGTAVVTVFGAPGGLDENFGVGGQVTTSDSLSYSVMADPDVWKATPSYRSGFVQADDKIIFTGSYWNGSRYQLQIVRFNADGSVDETFDGDSGTDNGFIRLDVGDANAVGRGGALQSDGKILIIAEAVDQGNASAAILRLNSDGSLDSSFDGDSGSGNGIVLYQVPNTAGTTAYAAAVQSDGKIVIAGGADASFFARLNANGTTDTSFGTNGATLVTSPNGPSYILQLLIRPNGKIIGSGGMESNPGVFVAQLTTSGAFDPDFDGSSGANGQLTIQCVPSLPSVAHTIALQADGKLIVGGQTWGGNSNNGSWAPLLVRLTVSGVVDTSFFQNGDSGLPGYSNGGGCLVLTNTRNVNVHASTGSLTSLAIQPNGKILAIFHHHNGSPAWGEHISTGFQILRFDENGIDTSFGTGGVSTGNFVAERIADLHLQSDGRILAFGFKRSGNYANFALQRIWP